MPQGVGVEFRVTIHCLKAATMATTPNLHVSLPSLNELAACMTTVAAGTYSHMGVPPNCRRKLRDTLYYIIVY